MDEGKILRYLWERALLSFDFMCIEDNLKKEVSIVKLNTDNEDFEFMVFALF